MRVPWLSLQAGSPLDLELQEAEVTRAGFFETLFRYLGTAFQVGATFKGQGL